MRLLLAVIITSSLHALPSMVTHVCALTQGNSSITTGSVTTTGASLLIGIIGVSSTNAANTISMSDSLANSYSALTNFSNAGGYQIQAFYTVPSSTGSQTFTASISPGSTNISICVEAWSGTSPISPLLTSNGNAPNGTAQMVTTPTLTITQPNPIIIAGGFLSNSGSQETYLIASGTGCGPTDFTLDDQISSSTHMGMAIAHCQENATPANTAMTLSQMNLFNAAWVGSYIAAFAVVPSSPVPQIH